MKNEVTEALDAMKKLSPLLLAGAGECRPLCFMYAPQPEHGIAATWSV